MDDDEWLQRHTVGPDHGDVTVEFTVRINRRVYDTDREYLAACRMVHDRTEAFINGLLGCRVWGRAQGNAAGNPLWWEQTTLDIDTDLL